MTGPSATVRLPKPSARFRCKDAVIDGEVVVPDESGVTHFGALQDAIANGESAQMVFYAFDLPYLNGYDLTAVPLVERKKLLEKLLAPVVGDTVGDSVSASMLSGRATSFSTSASEHGAGRRRLQARRQPLFPGPLEDLAEGEIEEARGLHHRRLHHLAAGRRARGAASCGGGGGGARFRRQGRDGVLLRGGEGAAEAA